jgi:hypothetical protein
MFMRLLVVLGLVGVLLLYPSGVYAQYTGTNYRIEEAQVGAVGGDNDLTSGTYKGRAGVGDTGVGNVTGTNFQAFGGFTTTDAPELEVSVNTLNLNLGNASTSSALTGSTKFGVRAYLTAGYTAYIRGVSPTQEGGYSMTSLATQTASSPGTEQFGINLSANNVPSSSPVCADLPNATFSFGTVNANYSNGTLYRYVAGDAVAQSPSSTGCTEYTVNYLVNISTTTRAGTYTFAQSIAVVATY